MRPHSGFPQYNWFWRFEGPHPLTATAMSLAGDAVRKAVAEPMVLVDRWMDCECPVY